MIIAHNAIVHNWNNNQLFENAKTLILGSFNPHNPNINNIDFYYGRETNYLWRVIAQLLGHNVNFYLNNLQNKLDTMNQYKFCFLDVINSIEVTCAQNPELEEQYIQNNILNEFADSKLFTTNTNFQGVNIKITRNYNDDIIEKINSNNIKKVIHTMGNNRISQGFITNPIEGALGFQGLINNVLQTNAQFVPESFSPSGRAVRVGGNAHSMNLSNWIQANLLG